MKRYTLAVLAYLVPTFALGFVWHLVLFESYYDALGIYRRDIIIPFGFVSMLIQGAIFAWVYDKAFAVAGGPLLSLAVRYGLVGAVLSWSFTTLAVAAKNVMASVPSYVLIETAFTIAQWVLVAPLTVATSFQSGRDERRVGAVG
jgi:ABC-type sugar transport system permease subunit